MTMERRGADTDPIADAGDPRPIFVVVEDGTEYVERFERFLGLDFRFVRAGDLEEAAGALAAARAPAGLLLDLDFSRAPPAGLCDETGAIAGGRPRAESRRLAETQGILVLRALRARGVRLPALLFADIEDPEQRAYLEGTLGPLAVVPSSESLPAVAARLRARASRH